MLARLSLRIRIFLFFCLIAAASIGAVECALWIGYGRAGKPELFDAFVFSGALSLFAILGITAGIWLLFDENVAKPIERLAAGLRARAHGGVTSSLDPEAARYLGDLAPAASSLLGKLGEANLSTAEAIARETTRLEAEKARLTTLLSEVPVATVMVSPDHRIVLYDAQAASVLSQIAPARLGAALGDYLEASALETAYGKMVRSGQEIAARITGSDGRQTYGLRLKPLGDAAGYVLIFDSAEARIAPEAARPLIYDFGLLNPVARKIEERRLSDLSFSVFDTETTGLLPHKDHVVQLGALRVLRGRIVDGEALDLLVDPGTPIPQASTKVHGITDAMVKGAPDFATVSRTFHHFSRDAVIVAHNAPFDMAFLHREAKRLDLSWDHPVLDTVLLSAVLFGASVPHTLDALCDRLDVTIPTALRHTALGDARATAEVLCRMLPMLEARGFATLGDVIEQTRAHGRLLEDLNPVDK